MKHINLYYNLLHCNRQDNNLYNNTNINIGDLVKKVYSLLDEDDCNNIDTEVFIDNTSELYFCNIFIKTKFQTINIQVIPGVILNVKKVIPEYLLEYRKDSLTEKLKEYGRELLKTILNEEYLVLPRGTLPKPSTTIEIDNWNQLQFNL